MEFVTQNMHIRVAKHNDFVQKRLETHLPGFRLVYFDNVCTVHQILPQQFSSTAGDNLNKLLVGSSARNTCRWPFLLVSCSGTGPLWSLAFTSTSPSRRKPSTSWSLPPGDMKRSVDVSALAQ